MGCLFALVAALSPRLGLILLWIFTPWVDRAFSTWVWPLLGLILLPLTTLVYVLLWNTGGRGVHGWEWALVVISFVVDLGAHAGGYRSR
jgi:hypothetical protein